MPLLSGFSQAPDLLVRVKVTTASLPNPSGMPCQKMEASSTDALHPDGALVT
jgi:hypothetical protein